MCDAKFDLLKLLLGSDKDWMFTIYFYLIANNNKQSPDSTVRVDL